MPRRLEFEVEPQIIENCPAQLVLGWATVKGTGLIDVVFGTDQFEPESEGMEIGEDMWVDIDTDEFEMPTLKGTPEQQLQFAALVKEHLSIFGPMPIDENGEGGSLLPPMNIELKRDAHGAGGAYPHAASESDRDTLGTVGARFELDGNQRPIRTFTLAHSRPY